MCVHVFHFITKNNESPALKSSTESRRGRIAGATTTRNAKLLEFLENGSSNIYSAKSTEWSERGCCRRIFFSLYLLLVESFFSCFLAKGKTDRRCFQGHQVRVSNKHSIVLRWLAWWTCKWAFQAEEFFIFPLSFQVMCWGGNCAKTVS